MTSLNQETIQADVLELMNRMARDWEYSGEISPQTYLFSDLGFESIDAVVLASFIQEHYHRQLPFPQLLAELGEREIKDIRVGELVGFIHDHIKDAVVDAAPMKEQA